MAHQRILEYLFSNHWAILPEVLQTMLSIAEGENESPEAVAERLGRPLQNTRTVINRDSVAVLPVSGPIFRYANILTEISGATSVEVLATDFRAALDDPDIRGIVLEIDSPGGQIAGISEFADQVAAAGKPTVAYISNVGASAGYWIASATQRVIIRDTAVAGSVGVVATLRRDKKDGDRIQIVSSQSPRKRVDPDTEEGRSVLQAVVDDIADVFIAQVASYRGVSAEHVLEHFGQGGLLVGRNAVSAGLADGLGSLESIIAGLAGQALGGKTMKTHQAASTAQAAGTANTAADVITTQVAVLDRATIEAQHPLLFEAIREEGRSSGRAEGWREGAEEERARIQAVKAVLLPGHEGLIERLMFDGTTTGPEAAALVIEAENKKRVLHLKAIKDDAPPPVAHAVAPDREAAAAADAALPLEERCKREWDSDPNLRAEFGDRYESYVAFTKAEAKGSVKIFARRA